MSIAAPASTEQFVVSLPTGAVESRAIDLTHAIGGLIFAPVGLVATALTFQVAAGHGADPTPALPAANNAAISLTVTAGAWAALPVELFSFPAFTFVLGGGEAADRAFKLALVRHFCAWRPVQLPIPSGGQASASVAGGGAFGGHIVVPAGLTGATLTFQVSGDGLGWTALPAQTITAGAPYPIPLAAARSPFFRVNAAGVQSAQRDIGGQLKLLG